MSKSTPLPKKSRSRGRAYLEKQLKKKGFSRRKAVCIVNALFAEMAAALGRGEEVEFPLGQLKVVRHKHRTQTGRFLNRKMATLQTAFYCGPRDEPLGRVVSQFQDHLAAQAGVAARREVEGYRTMENRSGNMESLMVSRVSQASS